MLLQIPILEDPFWSLVIALLLFGSVVSGFFAWIRRVRQRQIKLLNNLLTTQMTISIEDIARTLDKKGLDRNTTLGIIKLCENALLSFTGAMVVSKPLLLSHLRSHLLEDGVIRVAEESSKWGLMEDEISDLVAHVCKLDSLDVVRTTEGDFILVPDLKERWRDALDLYGRIDVTAEAQRMRVDRNELVRLILTWGWKLLGMSDGSLVSQRWMEKALVRGIGQDGYLDPKELSQRLDISETDIREATRRLGWEMIQTTDNRMIPKHILAEDITGRIEADGFIDLKLESERLLVEEKVLVSILRTQGLEIFATTFDTIVLMRYLEERIQEDLELTGMVQVQDLAETLGVKDSLVRRILDNFEGLRKGADGRYISLSSLRRWMMECFKESGIVKVSEVEKEWSLSSVTLGSLITHFGFKTVILPSGDYLSLAWARIKIQKRIEAGRRIEPRVLAKELGVEPGTAAAIVAQVEVDAILDDDGTLIPSAVIINELVEKLSKSGVIDPEREAEKRGIDATEIDRLLEKIDLDSLRTMDGKLISLLNLFKLMRSTLVSRGIFDAKTIAKRLKLAVSDLIGALEPHLEDSEFVAEDAGVIVNSVWIEGLREIAHRERVIRVTSFAKEKGIRRSALLALLRRYIMGAYVPRSDVYVAHIR